jgi:hypothetical protein
MMVLDRSMPDGLKNPPEDAIILNLGMLAVTK